jgi:hypothetical protein
VQAQRVEIDQVYVGAQARREAPQTGRPVSLASLRITPKVLFPIANEPTAQHSMISGITAACGRKLRRFDGTLAPSLIQGFRRAHSSAAKFMSGR